MRTRPSRSLERGDDLGEGVGRVLDGAAVARPSGGRARSPITSIWAYIMPRRLSVIAGRLPSKKPVSLMTPTSAASRSRLASSQASRCDRSSTPPRPRTRTCRLTGSPPRVAQQRLGRHDVEVDLALVVGRAAGEHPVADDDRLERRRGPQVERVDRLDVVVAVDEDRRGAVGVEPVRVDDRVARPSRDLDVLEAGRGQRRRPATRRRARQSGGVRRQGRDARDPQERLVRLEARVAASSSRCDFEGGRRWSRHASRHVGW